VSARRDKNLKQIEGILSVATILKCDGETARWYGQLEQKLRSKGRPIPQNDVWIAAVAMQYRLVLVTRDKHFEQVDNLVTQDW